MSQPNQATDYQRLFRTLPDTFPLLHPDDTVADNSDAHVAGARRPRPDKPFANQIDAVLLGLQHSLGLG